MQVCCYRVVDDMGAHLSISPELFVFYRAMAIFILKALLVLSESRGWQYVPFAVSPGKIHWVSQSEASTSAS